MNLNEIMSFAYTLIIYEIIIYFLIAILVFCGHYFNKRSIYNNKLVESMMIANGIGSLVLFTAGEVWLRKVSPGFHPGIVMIASIIISLIDLHYSGKIKKPQKVKKTA